MTDDHTPDLSDSVDDPGTQPASFDDLGMDSMSTMRPMATQAVFRPNFDDDDDSDSQYHSGDTEPQDQTTTVTRTLSPTRRLGGGLVEIPRVRPGIR